ncbi:MAG: uracil-DNA glycosylase [Phycisphaerales bacterium]|nr:uracil-DNA glycosylase [Phycisphaerales bacterium]
MPAIRVKSLEQLHRLVASCDRCERLRTYCCGVAETKRRAYADWDYWGKPVPGFGDESAWLWVIGLAPAAHGGNRTGRVFTGDRSGDFLFAALHRARFANQPTSVRPGDGLKLTDCYISATARCAPPANKPTLDEVAACADYLDAEWRLLKRKRVLFALGKIAWDASLALAARNGIVIPRPRPTFGHGAEVRLCDSLALVGSYHVSQQNTFTGKLTNAMLDDVLERSKQLAGRAGT